MCVEFLSVKKALECPILYAQSRASTMSPGSASFPAGSCRSKELISCGSGGRF